MKVNSWQLPMSSMYDMWNNNKTLTHYSMTKAQITIYNVLKGQKKKEIHLNYLQLGHGM